jgi:hypothetical protein
MLRWGSPVTGGSFLAQGCCQARHWNVNRGHPRAPIAILCQNVTRPVPRSQIINVNETALTAASTATPVVRIEGSQPGQQNVGPSASR